METTEAELGENIQVPGWLQVNNLEQMKKTMLEVIVVLLAVLFIKAGLETQAQTELNWNMVLIPLGIVAIGATIKLIGFDD